MYLTSSSYQQRSATHTTRLKCRSFGNDNGRTSKNDIYPHVTIHQIELNSFNGGNIIVLTNVMSDIFLT